MLLLGSIHVLCKYISPLFGGATSSDLHRSTIKLVSLSSLGYLEPWCGWNRAVLNSSAVSTFVQVPVLANDWMIHPLQVVEVKQTGAAGVLVSTLDNDKYF